jgi:membrane protease YdiL (CAAX protease family)
VGERTAAPARTWAPVALVVALIALSNVMTNRVLPGALYVPWNLGMAFVLLMVARGVDDLSADEVGLGRASFWRGIAHGGAVFGAILAVYLVALALPFTRDLFEDDRVGSVPFWGMAYQVFFRIPFGTVILEETAFRGVLLGMLLRRTTVAWAVTGSCLLFGLWHVLPSIGIERTNPVLEDLFGSAGAVVPVLGAVLGTAAAGAVFCWLRLRARSLVAPMMLHVATNSLGFFVAWWYLRLTG